MSEPTAPGPASALSVDEEIAAARAQQMAGEASRAVATCTALLARVTDPVQRAQIYDVQGRAYWSLPNGGAQAADAFMKALACLDLPDADPQALVTALDLAGLGAFYFGSQEEATALRRRALERAEADLPDDGGLLRRLRRRLAASIQEEGRISEAQALYLGATPAPDDSTEEKVSWNTSMGLLCEAIGDMGAALAHFEAVVELLEDAPQTVGFVQALANVGILLVEMDRTPLVAPHLRRMRIAARTDKSFGARTKIWDLRAAALLARGRYLAAAKVAQRALDAVEQEVGALHRTALTRRAQLEKMHRQAGNDAAADALLSTVLSDAPQSFDAVPLYLAATRRALQQDDGTTARDHLEAGFTLAAAQNDVEALSTALALAGDTAAAQGNGFAAALLGKLAIGSVRSTLATLDPEDAADWLKQRRTTYNTVLSRLAAQGRVGEASRLVLRSLHEDSVAALRGAQRGMPMVDVLLRSDETAHAQALEALLVGDSDLKATDWLAAVLAAEPAHAPPPFGEPDLPDVALLSGSAVLSAIETEDALALHLQNGATGFEAHVPVQAEALGALVLQMRTAMEDQLPDWRTPARALYDMLIAPLGDALVGVERLYVAVTGGLGFVPFSALHDGQSFVAERFYVAFLTGQRSPRPLPGPHTIFDVTAFLAEEFDGGLAQLSGRAEGAALQAHHNAQLHQGSAFTSEALLSALARAHVVHLATHFVHDPSAPGRSVLHLGDGTGFALSRIAEPGLQFEALELLTLPACETGVADGLGRNSRQTAQSLAGLAQARGARQVVASLWQVPDSATSALMANFYRHYAPQNGVDAPQALARAQREAIKSLEQAPSGASRRGIGSGQRKVTTALHPGDWAGFIPFVS